jgi:hypothetical protein
MPRKQRSDSTTEMLRIASGAERQIAPPAHIPMQDMDWPFWHNVVAEFARADWSEHQLELAAMLARTMADLEENQRLLRAEGALLERESFNPKTGHSMTVAKENPRARAVHTFMSQVLSMRRSLALHARAKSGSSSDAAKQRKAGKEIEERVASKDDLLA